MKTNTRVVDGVENRRPHGEATESSADDRSVTEWWFEEPEVEEIGDWRRVLMSSAATPSPSSLFAYATVVGMVGGLLVGAVRTVLTFVREASPRSSGSVPTHTARPTDGRDRDR